MSTSAANVGIVLAPTKQNRMIPRFSFTRSEVRRSHCHRWGHQHADSPKSPVQRTYQPLGQRAAEQLMGSTRMLTRVVRAIREASRIVASRGIDLRRYRSEMLVYRLPTAVSAPLMKRMFARNLLTRRIMTLHGNTADLLFVCRTVYEQGRANGVSAPIFYESYEAARDKATRHDQHLPGMVRGRNETA